jgi:hypothetical protein
MSNVLPQEVRKRVWRMYCARFLIAASLILIAVAAFAALALMPSYLALHMGYNTPAQESPADASRTSDRDAIVHAQALLSTLSPVLSATTTTALIADALVSRPATLRVYHITTTAGHPGSIILSGVADSIEAVSRYQSVLRADTHFRHVSVPVGDLAGTANGQFSITLSADF